MDSSKAAERHPNPEGDSAHSHGQQQGDIEEPKHRRLQAIARWGVNILIVGLLAAAMVVWVIFLAWVGRRLLALL